MAESQVRQFYTDKNIFLTGGTGFVGLCLIEKVLRSVPDVGRIYVLMRPKKGKEISHRLDAIAKDAIFGKLLETASPDIFKKLHPVAGDVSVEDLGLSAQDRQILVDNVHVVIHSAATLDFQDSLRPTVNVNLLGTRRIVQLCKQIKNLKALVHVSSAYVNAQFKDVHERVYDKEEDPERVIDLVNTLNDQELMEIEAKVLGSHTNTYTFTKLLAEHEVKNCSDLFPCSIVRPSMIVATWQEPMPGWTNSKVGPQGFIMGASKGVIRRLPMNTTNIYDYIPVDVVVNQILVAGYNAAKSKSGLSVYHATSSTSRPFTWGSVESKVNQYLQMYPLKGAVWYPYLKFVSSLWLFKLSAIFVHFLPAYILDAFIRIGGGRPILVRLHKNVWNSLDRLKPFIFTEWRFHNPNTRDLNASLSPTDKKLFYIDISTLNWDEYFIKLTLGVRLYLSHESLKTLPMARSKATVLLVLHMLLQLCIVAGGWWAIASGLGLTMRQAAWAAPLTYVLYSFL